jgi:hypothetical protein
VLKEVSSKADGRGRQRAPLRSSCQRKKAWVAHSNDGMRRLLRLSNSEGEVVISMLPDR